jgi:branched-chain amino acid transport system permease protein
LMAVGLSLVFGVMNIPNFAHGEFYMLGAYVAYFVFAAFHMGPVAAILAAMLVTLIVGAIVEKCFFYSLRMRSKDQWLMNTFLVTLGLSIMMQNGARIIWGSTYRGITEYWPGKLALLSGMRIASDRIIGFGIAMVAIAVFWVFLNKTSLGRAIRAVSQDENGALLMGISLNNIHTVTFALSCMLAGLAGASLLSINPAYPIMGAIPLYKSWFVLILVGMGNIGASIYGGLIVGLLETVSYYIFGAGWQDAISLLIIIIILVFKPAGLFARKGVKTVWEQ